MKRSMRKLILLSLIVLTGWFLIWFSLGLPRTFQLRELDKTPGFLVYADETTAPAAYRQWAGFLDACPMPSAIRRFLLQYCEAKSSRVVVRGLHPLTTPEEIAPLEEMQIVHFLDLQVGRQADLAIEEIVARAPNLRILHLTGDVSENGLRSICRGLPELEDLYLARARIQGAVTEFENGLLKLQGVTFSECSLDREFLESLDNRPDVKIAIHEP